MVCIIQVQTKTEFRRTPLYSSKFFLLCLVRGLSLFPLPGNPVVPSYTILCLRRSLTLVPVWVSSFVSRTDRPLSVSFRTFVSTPVCSRPVPPVPLPKTGVRCPPSLTLPFFGRPFGFLFTEGSVEFIFVSVPRAFGCGPSRPSINSQNVSNGKCFTKRN